MSVCGCAILLLFLIRSIDGFRTVPIDRRRLSVRECNNIVKDRDVESKNSGNPTIPIESGLNHFTVNQIEIFPSLQLESSKIFAAVNENNSNNNDTFDATDVRRTIIFLVKASMIGIFTGLGVKVFKSSIDLTAAFFFETLAEILPRPAFYWPLGLYPLLGSVFVSILVYLQGNTIYNGIDYIAKTIDSSSSCSTPTAAATSTNWTSFSSLLILPPPLPHSLLPEPIRVPVNSFNPASQFMRLLASVFTLGSGCSLGPEGPSVELGAGLSRLMSGEESTAREQHHLFLAGAAAGVSAGFSAPIAGILFAIECGNRYLNKNTIKLDEDSPDGPRSDVAAIALAATLASIVVHIGGGSVETLRIQGNSFAMQSPGFELPMYLGLGLLSGFVSVCFTSLKDILSNLFQRTTSITTNTSISRFDTSRCIGVSNSQQTTPKTDPKTPDEQAQQQHQLLAVPSTASPSFQLADIPSYLRPLLGGSLCGLAAVYYPQSLFTGYSTLDELLAGNYHFDLPLLLQLLIIKVSLSAFSLATGLIGGVFAPSIFFGAAVGTAYHQIILDAIAVIVEGVRHLGGNMWATSASQFMTVANAPAYATVGAAATLGALFRAPLTSSMLMFELTQNHEIVLPVLASTGLAGLFAEILSHPRKQW